MPGYATSKRALQAVNALMGVATVALGGIQLGTGIGSPIYADLLLPQAPVLDSNLRFFGGLALGLGLALLWITPRVEEHSRVFGLVWVCAFLGGLGRLASWAAMGAPSLPLAVFTGFEVICAPLLVLWQRGLAKNSGVSGT